MESIIQVEQLYKQYQPPTGAMAVDGISFHINKGEIFSLLGPNGAGKTTTISMLSCLLRPTKGEIIIDGHSIQGGANEIKKVIGVVPQEIALYDTITARENLSFWGKMYGLRGAFLEERIAAVLEIAGLADRADEKIESYSGGMKRRINIAVGLLHRPKILFMDEPTVGIDPQSRRRILDTVKRLNEEGLTVIYTTHYMEEAEELSDRIGIIDHGKLIRSGSLAELTKAVGELQTIDLQFGDLDENDRLVALLSGTDGVTHIVGRAGGLLIQTENAHQILPRLLQIISENGRLVKELKIKEPNLEAVFLHLTGHALRD